MQNHTNKYDVVIIGAGISGLIAGNYLAKAGLKVFITEQHYAVGGCCSFFKRKGFTFECGAHSLGSCRKPDGYLFMILNELGIYDLLDIKRSVCSDTVITKNYTINFSQDANKMAENLSKEFKQYKKQIYNFFDEIEALNSESFLKYHAQYRNITFDEYLSKFFNQSELKEILSVFLGNLGVASDQISAITALALYKEFLLDGGYYVKGGMQKLGDVLKKNYQNNGGIIALSNKAIKIHLQNGVVAGVETEKKGLVNTQYVISTVGIKQTFFHLIDSKFLSDEFCLKVKKTKPSVSALILYLGLKGSEFKSKEWGRTIWYMPNLNANHIYRKTLNGECDEDIEVSLIGFPSRYDESLVPSEHESLMCIVAAPFKDEEFWKKNKPRYKDAVINRLSELIPNLKDRIIISEMATPITIQRYTLNDDGAIYGLASLKHQISIDCMPQKTPIKNLFLSSHWTTQGYGQGGVPVVALAGKKVAMTIIKNKLSLKREEIKI